jgi:hypothetical protein
MDFKNHIINTFSYDRVGLEGFHSSPIPDIPLMCFALYILLKGRSVLHIAAINNNVEAAKLFLLPILLLVLLSFPFGHGVACPSVIFFWGQAT